MGDPKLHALDTMTAFSRAVTAILAALSTKQLIRACIGFMASHPMLLLALLLTPMVGSLAPPVEALAGAAAIIYSVSNTLGIAWLVAWMMSRVVADASAIDIAGFARLIVCLIERFALLALALVAVRRFAPELGDLVRAIQANPEASVASIVGAALVWIAFSLAGRLPLASSRESLPVAAAVMSGPARELLSQRDIKRTAVHETGHLLMYAALPRLPERLFVEVRSSLRSSDAYRGQVMSSDELVPSIVTGSYIRWAMLRHLAGSQAEASIFGDEAEGSCDDTRQWTSAATHYLGSGFGEVFYPSPIDEGMREHNRSVINDLRRRQRAALCEFFTLNASVLRDLAALVEQRLRLERDEIAPFLAKVRFTETVARVPAAGLDQ